MCFHSRLAKQAKDLEHRFDAVIHEEYFPSDHYSGFEYPKTPVITNEHPHEIELFEWGLIPPNVKSEPNRVYTLNARIETLEEKFSFKSVTHNRCLVISDGYYECQWLTTSGSRKQKYLLHLENEDIFAFAGLWSKWINPNSGQHRHTYTILTAEANELLSKIHNSKKRMPVVLNRDQEKPWLGGEPLDVDMNIPLIATPLGRNQSEQQELSLF